MKKLFGILLVMALISFYGCCIDTSAYKYKVSDADGSYYLTNQVTIQNGCVKFTDLQRNAPVTICGSYSITENKGYKPQKK